MWQRSFKNKYGNHRIKTPDGTFDSRHEFDRWNELKLYEMQGLISDLRRQVKFLLIPAQREPAEVGPHGGKKLGKLIEKECAYYADFVYVQNDKTVVEDAKGVKTPEYVIKRKLMLERYGIRIQEV